MKTRTALVFLFAASLLLAACAPGPNEFTNLGLNVAGFWRGLWHGVIAPVTFVISLFTNNVGVYEIHNNGGWYNFGFIIGILCHHGGSAAGRNVWRKPKGGVATAR
jgi:hypothetical protein